MIPTGFQVELLDYEDNSKITYRHIEPTYGERYLGAGFHMVSDVFIRSVF